MKKVIKKRKVFTGNLTGPYLDKEDRNFNKTALKAYLKGWDYFTFGRNTDGSKKKHFVPKGYVQA